MTQARFQSLILPSTLKLFHPFIFRRLYLKSDFKEILQFKELLFWIITSLNEYEAVYINTSTRSR